MRKLCLVVSVLLAVKAHAQIDTTKSKIPFEGIDQSWYNGGDRRTTPPVFESKYFTGSVILDVNYSYSFANPNDNTVVGSTALARDNEVQLALGVIGGEFNYKNARGKLFLQMGTNSTVIPRDDYSPYRGQYQLPKVYTFPDSNFVQDQA